VGNLIHNELTDVIKQVLNSERHLSQMITERLVHNEPTIVRKLKFVMSLIAFNN
jgi:hypothetical protein